MSATMADGVKSAMSAMVATRIAKMGFATTAGEMLTDANTDSGDRADHRGSRMGCPHLVRTEGHVSLADWFGVILIGLPGYIAVIIIAIEQHKDNH